MTAQPSLSHTSNPPILPFQNIPDPILKTAPPCNLYFLLPEGHHPHSNPKFNPSYTLVLAFNVQLALWLECPNCSDPVIQICSLDH